MTISQASRAGALTIAQRPLVNLRPQLQKQRSLRTSTTTPPPNPLSPLHANHHVDTSHPYSAGAHSPNNLSPSVYRPRRAPPSSRHRISLHHITTKRHSRRRTTRRLSHPASRAMEREERKRVGPSRQLLPPHRDDAGDVRSTGAVFQATVSIPTITAAT